MTIFPVKLIYPAQKPDREGKRKELSARNAQELARLIRLGWVIKPVETK